MFLVRGRGASGAGAATTAVSTTIDFLNNIIQSATTAPSAAASTSTATAAA